MDSVTSLRSLILVGASGKLGPSILQSLQASAKYNISVLTRIESTATYPAGVNHLRSDFSEESLFNAFKGQDGVICVLGGKAVGLQIIIIDAAARAGVKHYMPSEFGSDSLNPRIQERLPAAKIKASIIEHLIKTSERVPSFTWTALAVGALFDLCLRTGFLGWDIPTASAILYGDGAYVFPATTLRATGDAVTIALQQLDQTRNRYCYICEFMANSNGVLQVLEQVTAKSWSLQRHTMTQAVIEGRQKLAEGNFGDGIKLINRTISFDESLDGSSAFERNAADRAFPDLPRRTLEGVVKDVISSDIVAP